ncbi:MFS transporter [Micromonospora sonneratiae]|uniref:MFS transporter n=1 Tax=Micromonospora sonneratiae TaxID=1184706 RepID=A0ABW3YCL8_9ACTN
MTATEPATLAPAAPSLFTGRFRALTVGTVTLVSLLAFESLAVTTAMPTVARSLDGLALYALAFGGPFASGVVGMVVSGIWSDARGPGTPTRHGVLWFVVGLLIAGSAQSMGWVAAGRIVQGFGSGLLSVALYVTVGRAYPEDLHRRIFAAFAAAWVVPSLVGPAIAGLIVQYVGWRWVFLAVPVLTVPAMLLIQPGLRRIDAPVSGPRTAPGTFRRIAWAFGAAVSAALLHYGGQQRGATAVVLLAVAVVGLGLCAPRLLPAGFLRLRRGLPTVIALRGLASAAFAGAEVFIPLLLSRERGLSPAAAGFALAAGALAWSAGSALQSRLTQPRLRAALPRVGMLCVAAGIGFVALTVSESVPVLIGIAGWGVAGAGMGMVYPTLSVLTLELSAPGEEGCNSSALQLGDSLFAATVLAFGGAMFAATTVPGAGTYLAGFAVAAGLALLGAVISGRVDPRSTT